MRKITAGLFITLDGVIESANEWTGPYFHPRINASVGSIMGAADCMLIGRVTYDEFAAYWPQQTGPLADVMNGTPKYVVSNTLREPAWQNCTVVDGDIVTKIAALKAQAGRNIGVTGSATLVATLVRAGLIDELTLYLMPIVRGRGKRLFDDPGDVATLELEACEALDNGVVILQYRPAKATSAQASSPDFHEQAVAASA